jgi:catechol 2,3-dioxygenase
MADTYKADAVIGHVHLKAADMDRAIDFYAGVLGFEMQAHWDKAAFLSSGGYHHHVALNVWDSAGGMPPPRHNTGLFHAAFLHPDRPALGRAVRRVLDAGIVLTGKADHGVSEAVVLDDPDGNGVELYRDRLAAEWPRDPTGRLVLTNGPLDLDALLADAAS